MKRSRDISKLISLDCAERRICFYRTSQKRLYEVTPFQKYYHIAYILNAIELYQTGKIADRTLASWAHIYDTILNSEGKKGIEEFLLEDGKITIPYILKKEITWALDGLSFYSEEHFEAAHTASYAEWFLLLDDLYVNQGEWEFFYAPNHDTAPSMDVEWDISLMAVHHGRKVFCVVISEDLLDVGKDIDATMLGEEELPKKKVQLLEAGYTDITTEW